MYLKFCAVAAGRPARGSVAVSTPPERRGRVPACAQWRGPGVELEAAAMGGMHGH